MTRVRAESDACQALTARLIERRSIIISKISTPNANNYGQEKLFTLGVEIFEIMIQRRSVCLVYDDNAGDGADDDEDEPQAQVLEPARKYVSQKELQGRIGVFDG